MNKFTYKELQKIDHLIQTTWDDTTTHLVIQRGGGIPVQLGFKPGDKFTIQIADYILNQPPNFTLSENWNRGTFPPEEVLDVEVIKVIGKMVGVRAKGTTTGLVWEGWLPEKGISII